VALARALRLSVRVGEGEGETERLRVARQKVVTAKTSLGDSIFKADRVPFALSWSVSSPVPDADALETVRRRADEILFVTGVPQRMRAEIEEAAASLGATRGQTLGRVILPALFPALLTGTAMAFARAVGEYGSVVFISGNMPFKTEIAPVLIVSRLEEFAYAEATTVAVMLLGMSLTLLVIVNALQQRLARNAQ
jgi:hypothetical protein